MLRAAYSAPSTFIAELKRSAKKNMNTEITKPVKRKLKTHEHVISGIPFLLVIVGGAIGGGVGGGAYAINASLFRKEMPNAKKYL